MATIDPPPGRLRIGTRGSALALRQSEWVATRLRARHPGLETELCAIQTSGDRIRERPLYEIGGKGLFVKEIEEAILDGRVDVGVHSLKDLPAALAAGLEIVAVPEREDAGDVLVASTRGGLAALPSGARVGTASLRRGAFVRAARADLQVVSLRGNVDTRLRKWRDGEIDALLLAAAGLRRLGIDLAEATALTSAEMLPAVGQGALALEAAPGSPWWATLRAVEDPDSAATALAERGFLVGVGGDCKTPIAAHARLDGDVLALDAAIAAPDGSSIVRGAERGRRSEAWTVGRRLAGRLLDQGGRAILEAIGR